MSAVPSAPAGGPFRSLPAYLEIMRGELRIAMAYRQNVFFMLAAVVVQIFILHKVWTSLYGSGETVDGIGLSEVLVYVTLANLHHWVMQDSTFSSYLYSRVREGRVVFDLVRPVGFVPQMLAHLVGGKVTMALFAVVVLPVVAVIGRLGPPASAAACGLWLLSLVCALAIAILLNLMVGLSAFWTTETQAFTLLVSLVGQFLAGAWVPLYFFPDPLRTMAELLPFQAMTFTPVAVYLGRMDGVEALRAIGVQGLWVVLLAVAVRFIWSRALHRVVVQGG